MKFITLAVALFVSASAARHHHHPKTPKPLKNEPKNIKFNNYIKKMFKEVKGK